ncbi:hypothetical protein O3P69_014264 [Scylla paramamosain]|uniref:Uncharacterized protein n=1 Tax=Scylla paramamosain TaxID=85552 RepID=A0AAW0TB88_SCYPA
MRPLAAERISPLGAVPPGQHGQGVLPRPSTAVSCPCCATWQAMTSKRLMSRAPSRVYHHSAPLRCTKCLSRGGRDAAPRAWRAGTGRRRQAGWSGEPKSWQETAPHSLSSPLGPFYHQQREREVEVWRTRGGTLKEVVKEWRCEVCSFHFTIP